MGVCGRGALAGEVPQHQSLREGCWSFSALWPSAPRAYMGLLEHECFVSERRVHGSSLATAWPRSQTWGTRTLNLAPWPSLESPGSTWCRNSRGTKDSFSPSQVVLGDCKLANQCKRKTEAAGWLRRGSLSAPCAVPHLAAIPKPAFVKAACSGLTFPLYVK